ncbi:MAG TPA: hypothetical protein DHW82_02105 [Spirochaetia bacterium]|nr:MAG: hypothetical protein A2Y41_10650 [Spirochaetes bacterium GWB1_36_13]HCL55790.1 hypothetical protein [Spirochaetia bacterium]
MMKKAFFIMLFLALGNVSFSYEKVFFGKASWYGEPFHGRKTASGEIYDMNKITAAHKELPFGTVLKITNLDNGKSIMVKVNDRGPFVAGRILDLSKKAAEELEYIKKGVVNIKAEVVFMPGGNAKNFEEEVLKKEETKETKQTETKEVKKEEPKEKEVIVSDDDKIDEIIQTLKAEDLEEKNKDTQASKETSGKLEGTASDPLEKEFEVKNEEIKKEESVNNSKSDTPNQNEKMNQLFYIQLGAFSFEERAVLFQKYLKDKGIDSYILKEQNGSLLLYKIRENKVYKELDPARTRANEIKSKGIECFVIGKFFL